MKKLMLVAMTLLSLNVWAGKDRGGGHPAESGFRQKVMDLVSEMANAPEKFRKQLSFNALDLFGYLNGQNNFKALCAVDTDLEQLRLKQKMAFVFAHSKNTVSLNCEDYRLYDWIQLWDSEDLTDAIFFIHEALRTKGEEGEDDYGKSSSAVPMIRALRAFKSSVFYDLLYTEGECKLSVGYRAPRVFSRENFSRHVAVTLSVRGKKVTTTEYYRTSYGEVSKKTEMEQTADALVAGQFRRGGFNEFSFESEREHLWETIRNFNCAAEVE